MSDMWGAYEWVVVDHGSDDDGNGDGGDGSVLWGSDDEEVGAQGTRRHTPCHVQPAPHMMCGACSDCSGCMSTLADAAPVAPHLTLPL